MRLILASSSPYRRELLARLGLAFEVLAPHIDESPRPGEDFRATALRLATEKATAIAQQHPDAIVIGSDQVAHCNALRLDKPGSAEKAIEQLKAQRGKVSIFHTAVCVARDAGTTLFSEVVSTDVRFLSATALTDAMIARYVAIENPIDCAGGAKSEGLGITLMAAMGGDDPTALVGLPLIALTRLLRQAGLEPLG